MLKTEQVTYFTCKDRNENPGFGRSESLDDLPA